VSVRQSYAAKAVVDRVGNDNVIPDMLRYGRRQKTETVRLAKAGSTRCAVDQATHAAADSASKSLEVGLEVSQRMVAGVGDKYRPVIETNRLCRIPERR
jgi:hypothetical protein